MQTRNCCPNRKDLARVWRIRKIKPVGQSESDTYLNLFLRTTSFNRWYTVDTPLIHNGVSTVYQRCINGVSTMYLRFISGVSTVYQRCIGVENLIRDGLSTFSGKIEYTVDTPLIHCWYSVSTVYQRCNNGVSTVYQRCINGVWTIYTVYRISLIHRRSYTYKRLSM